MIQASELQNTGTTWSQSYGYDAFGNRSAFSGSATPYSAVTPTAAMPGAPWTLGQDFTAGVNVQGQTILGGPFNGSNQWTSALYDGNGNQTSGASTILSASTSYDGENHAAR